MVVETGVPGENHQLTPSILQYFPTTTLFHIVLHFLHVETFPHGVQAVES